MELYGPPFVPIKPQPVIPLQYDPNCILKLGGDGKFGNSGNPITGFGGVKLIASGNVGVTAVLSAILIADLFMLLGRIPAFTSNGTIGSLTGLKLPIPYPAAEPKAKFGLLFLLNSPYLSLSGETDLS